MRRSCKARSKGRPGRKETLAAEIDTRFVVLLGLGIAVLTIASLLAAAALHAVLSTGSADDARESAGSGAGGAKRLEEPPGLRRRHAPVAELARLREDEDRILNDYAWIDREEGVFRIPIERAMEILAREGLPARQEPPARDGVGESGGER